MHLATFNILHGRSTVDGEVDLDRYASAVAALDADVLALQEVDRDQPRSHGADLTAVAAEAMEATEHRFVATLAGTPKVWTAATGDLQPSTAGYGIALLSRYPVLSWLTLSLPALPRRVPFKMPTGRRPVLVRDEPRAALAAVLDAPGGLVTVVSTHLTFLPGWNVTQLRHLVRSLRDLPRPLVLMGDLNMAGDRPTRLTGWRSLASGETFPAGSPTRQLDHILADGELTPKAPGEALETGLSDHRALMVHVARPVHAVAASPRPT